jgi:hypothetical protein
MRDGLGLARALGCTLLASALAAGGCASRGLAFETVSALPEPAQHPAGTDVDRQSAWPTAERRGATGSALVVLRTPIAPAAARRVIAAFFHALVLESPRELSALFTPDATMQNGARREGAGAVWGSRFARFDYASLAGELIYSDADLKLTSDDDDLLVEVPIKVSWGSRPRMLGDALIFRLTARGAGWLIAEMVEDFRGP